MREHGVMFTIRSCTFLSVLVFLIIVISLLQQVSTSLSLVNVLHTSVSSRNAVENHAKPLCFTHNPLMYIPPKTLRVWGERDFLVVFGIPSLDIEKRRWRRHMQRTTCWQFPEVATRQNNYTGAMMVLYLLARHPLNNFTLSEGVVREAKQWRDVLIHPMNEGLSDTDKMKVGVGYWGTEAEIGSARKTYFWFQTALQLFPRAPYLAKLDDDTFLRVPQYLADLRRLPMGRVYWGRQAWWRGWVNRRGRLGKTFMFVLGFCVTLSRDVADHVISYEPLKKMIWVPYSKERAYEFRLLSMENEDIMVARVLAETKYPVLFVKEPLYRFRTVPTLPVTDAVVATHTPKEHEYYVFMNRFLVNGTTTPETSIIKESGTSYRMNFVHGMSIISG